MFAYNRNTQKEKYAKLRCAKTKTQSSIGKFLRVVNNFVHR